MMCDDYEDYSLLYRYYKTIFCFCKTSDRIGKIKEKTIPTLQLLNLSYNNNIHQARTIIDNNCYICISSIILYMNIYDSKWSLTIINCIHYSVLA